MYIGYWLFVLDFVFPAMMPVVCKVNALDVQTNRNDNNEDEGNNRAVEFDECLGRKTR